jgi:hypothetical protein
MSTRCGTSRLIYPPSLAQDINVTSMSDTRLNNKGDEGSSCLKHFLVRKYLPISSFTFTSTFSLLDILTYPMTPFFGESFYS